jgi:hypothetical protein
VSGACAAQGRVVERPTCPGHVRPSPLTRHGYVKVRWLAEVVRVRFLGAEPQGDQHGIQALSDYLDRGPAARRQESLCGRLSKAAKYSNSKA